LLITGAGAVPVVVKLEFVDVEETDKAFADITSKSYAVPGVRPVRVTEWLVTSIGSSALDKVYVVVSP
jgi:hypothetical protein